MKVKTSITLSRDLLETIDERTRHKNRSDFIETALWEYIARIVREEQNKRDINIINKRSKYLNKEAEDVLSYQVKL
ncbi:MAG: ribbon-helix-helix protein, CopG family [Deltaproteobacteria bacterium]|nr:ribbon-helix-helix protein, CopG family [Deltaproteobacteria bacterium]